MESIWFLFWWCPLLSVDCFHKLFLLGTPSENSQVGWDLWNRMASGYRFDAKWVCPMGSYVWSIQVFCSVREMRRHLISRTEHFSTPDITSHGTDSFPTRLINTNHPIPKISTNLFSEEVPERQFVKTIDRQERTSSEKKSDRFHKKCSIELWIILMFELLLCCHTAARCMEQT